MIKYYNGVKYETTYGLSEGDRYYVQTDSEAEDVAEKFFGIDISDVFFKVDMVSSMINFSERKTEVIDWIESSRRSSRRSDRRIFAKKN